MVNVRILFLMLSVVTTFNCNDVSAANPNNQIEILLERLIQKVDLLEKNMEKVSFQADDLEMDAAQTKKTINGLVTDVENVKTNMASSTYNVISDEVKKHYVNVEDVSHALAEGYHFVGNGYEEDSDDSIEKHISFSHCVDMCTKKRDADGEAWNSFYWSGYDYHCACLKSGRGHSQDVQYVHFRI